MILRLALLIHLSLGTKWILDPGNYFTIKELNNSFTLGLLWGNEYTLNHEMVDTSSQLSVPYADPGIFYMQKVYDASLSLEITQTWKIEENAWELTFEGRHKGKSNFDKTEKLVNLAVFGALNKGNLEYKDNKWVGDFIFHTEFSHDHIIRTAKVSDPAEKTWKVKKFIQKWLYDSYVEKHSGYGSLTPKLEEKSNMFFINIHAKAPFALKFCYNTCISKPTSAFIADFKEKFKVSFGSPLHADFEYNTLSYLLSGLSYFEGKIQISAETGIRMSASGSLLTFVPSRVSFPRGFLWDEGFHLLVASQWNKPLCLEVLNSWLNTMNEDGWIPREQIRGPAAETRVPPQFIAQHPEVANPPSLVFFVQQLIEDLLNTPPEKRTSRSEYKILKSSYSGLKKWYYWIKETQTNKDGMPMWKGRSADHNLASGLDDYPRGLQVSNSERHLDLYMWLIMFAKTLRGLSEIFDEIEDRYLFDKSLKELLSVEESFKENNAFKGFLGEQYINQQGQQAYYWRGDNQCKNVKNPLGHPAECNPYGDSPCCSEFGWCGSTPAHCNCEKCAKYMPLEMRKNIEKKTLFSPHIGYVSLMPLIVGHAKPQSKEFENILEYISSPSILWSKYGLRSLSKSDLLFKTGENYWRGEIWVNFNYLVLRGLKKYYWSEEKCRVLYSKLRENIINTIYQSWNSTGYVWEQYSENAGNGLRVHPFTGWTSLILNIIHEKF